MPRSRCGAKAPAGASPATALQMDAAHAGDAPPAELDAPVGGGNPAAPPVPQHPEGSQLSAYEQRRLQTIRGNETKLDSLGLLDPVKPPREGKRRRPLVEKEPAGPPRRTTRETTPIQSYDDDAHAPAASRRRSSRPASAASSSSAPAATVPVPPRPPAGFDALTVRQPYASGIVRGHTRVENRTWRVAPGTWLAIHAGAALANDAELVGRLRRAWADMPSPDDLPRSAIVGFAHVAEVVEHSASSPHESLADDLQAVGPCCWVIDQVVPLHSPVTGVSGQLGTWRWTPPAGFQPPPQLLQREAATSASAAASPADSARVAAPPHDARADAVATESEVDAAREQARRLSAGAAPPAYTLVLAASLACADVYVRATRDAELRAGWATRGAGVVVAVSDRGEEGERELHAPMALRPATDSPASVRCFEALGVWRLRWMLESARVSAQPKACSPPRRPRVMMRV